MIEVNFRGGFGDFLFQYSFARLLAVATGTRLAWCPVPGFPKTRKVINGREIYSPAVRWSGHWPFCNVSLSNVPAIPTTISHRLALDGFFQRYSFYCSHKNWLADWFYRPSLPPRPQGDFLICLKNELPGWYGDMDEKRQKQYESVLSCISPDEVEILKAKVPHDRLFYLVDSPEDTKAYPPASGAIVATGLQLFDIVKTFRQVSFSQSALQWWAVYLSPNAETIYFPNCTLGIWSVPMIPESCCRTENEGIALKVPENRYRYSWWN